MAGTENMSEPKSNESETRGGSCAPAREVAEAMKLSRDVKNEMSQVPLAEADGSVNGDVGAIALLRCLPMSELESAYRSAKADETDKGQHAACLIGRELIRRASPSPAKIMNEETKLPTTSDVVTGQDKGRGAPAPGLAWLAISADCLPPLETPVWLYMPEVRKPMIGCRTEDDGAWFWARCYDDFWFDGQWKTSTAEMDDLKPSHWMPLPLPPDEKGQR